MERWFCEKCGEFPVTVFYVMDRHVEEFFWDDPDGDYEYGEIVENGDIVSVECPNGHAMVQREFQQANSPNRDV